MKGEKVLITGGLGFVGSNLAHRCLALGAEITVYDCLDPKSGGYMCNVEGIEKDIQIILNDIRNFEGISACIRDKTILFNCAAYTSHPNSMKEPLVDIEVNCRGTINILEAARRFNPSLKIVHVGTSTQVGKMCVNPIDELHPEFPVDIYSANKTASEKYVLIYGHAYHMKTTVIRLANVFGPRSNIKSPDFGFMNYFIGLALQGKELSIFGRGEQVRNITYVEDCVEALIQGAKDDRSNGEVFFAVADGHHTVEEIAKEITRIMGGRIRYVDWPKDREVIEIGDATITNEKMKSLLGWKPQIDIRNGLLKTKEYFVPRLSLYLK